MQEAVVGHFPSFEKFSFWVADSSTSRRCCYARNVIRAVRFIAILTGLKTNSLGRAPLLLPIPH
jgi:hypothetical protein